MRRMRGGINSVSPIAPSGTGYLIMESEQLLKIYQENRVCS